MGRYLAAAVFVLCAPTWADVDSSLDQELEWAANDGYVAARPVVGGAPLHALFYQADPDRFIIDVGVWWTRLSGPVTFSNGAKLDVSDTLGLKARKTVPFVRLGWRIGWFELIFEGFWYDNAGDQLVTEEFEIEDVVFEVGDIIKSDIKIHSYRLSLGFTVTRQDWITLTFQLGLGALRTEGSIATVSFDKRATWDQWLPLPLVGAAVKGYFGKYPWIYEAQFNWIGFSTDALGASAIDARLAFGYEFNDWTHLKIGYRFYGINAKVDQVEVDVDLSGFYVEFALMF